MSQTRATFKKHNNWLVWLLLVAMAWFMMLALIGTPEVGAKIEEGSHEGH